MVEDAIINGEISNDYSSAMSFLDQIKQQKNNFALQNVNFTLHVLK